MPALDPALLDVLACPSPDHAPLEPVGDWPDPKALRCSYCGSTYPVHDGVPQLLLDEATAGPRGIGVDQRSST